MISSLSNKHEWSLWQQTGAKTGVWRGKNCVVLHAVKMAFRQVYNLVIRYDCIYLSELWCFGVLDHVSNFAFLLK